MSVVFLAAPPGLSWYRYFIWPVRLQLLLLLFVAVVCTWHVLRRAARERRFATLLPVVITLVSLPGWLGLTLAAVEYSRDFYLEISGYPHGPMPDQAFAVPWAYALTLVHVGLFLSLPGYLIALGILYRRATHAGESQTVRGRPEIEHARSRI